VTKDPYNPKSASFNGSIDYYLNETNSIGIGSQYINTKSDRISKSENYISWPSETNSLITQNDFVRERSTFNINPYYEFKNEDHQLQADFNFVNYINNNTNTIYTTPDSNVDYTSQRYLQDSEYTIKTYKLDYKRLFSEDFILSFGTKLAQVDSESDLKSFVQNTNGNFDFDSNSSNLFAIDETIFALYSKLNYKLNDWTFSTGLRFEDSKTKGVSSNANDSRERNISKLFPSASVSRKLGEHLAASVSYSYRIRRPSYSTLNSFVTFYDPLSSDVGNPTLKPSFTNNSQFNLTYDGQPFFTIAYSTTKDALFQFIAQDNDTAQITRSTINLSHNENWSFRVFGPLNFISKKVEGFSGFIVNYNQYKSELLTPQLNLSKWSLIWYTQAEYALPYDIKAEISGQYGTGVLEGQIEMEWFAGLDFAMSKTFLDGKLKANMGMRKVLNRPFVGSLQYDNVNADIISDQSRQNVYLQLAYKFGSKFNKRKEKRNASEDEENRINDNN
jgi:outer membrane receptor protein involved in Fe transport